ncbi:MAG: hypothetical protein AB1Z18_03750 [Desulfobacterales bacterium]
MLPTLRRYARHSETRAHTLSVGIRKKENIYAVYQKPKTQLGIVQSDVLAFVAKVETNPVLKRIAQKTRMVFPLYNEEIHLPAKKNILDFDYLIRLCPKIPGRRPATAYCTAVRRGQPCAGLD